MREKLINYLGQLRIYSLADLAELLLVAGATGQPLWGAVVLHVGFLAFLESKHHHEGREPVPVVLPWLLFLQGLRWLGSDTVGTAYLCFSVVYTFKKQGCWGLVSPFARGAQTFALIYPFAADRFGFLLTIAIAMAARNVIGDLRDVEQDRQAEEGRREGMCTWPVVLGLRRDLVFAHLFATMGTTWLWWGFSHLSVWWPILINLIQLATYWLTPRPSNKKAAQRLRQILRTFRR